VKLSTDLHLVPGSKNAWSYTFTPQYAFMAWCAVKRSTGTTSSSPSPLPYVSRITPSGVFRITTSEVMNPFRHFGGFRRQGIAPSKGLCLHRTSQHRHNRTSMPRSGFELVITVFSRTSHKHLRRRPTGTNAV